MDFRHIFFQVLPARLSAQSVIMAQVLCFFFMVLPLMAFSMWNEWEHLKQLQSDRLLRSVNALASRQTTLTGSTESLLLALSLSPEVRQGNSDRLFSYLSLFDDYQQDYAGFALFRMDGSSVVSFLAGMPRELPREVILARKYFSRAVSHRDFSVGNALVLSEGNIILPMAMPVLDSRMHPHFVLMAPLSMRHQYEVMRSMLGKDTSEVFLFDSAFTCLFSRTQTKSPSGLPFTKEFIVSKLLPHAYIYSEDNYEDRVTFQFLSPEGESMVGCMAVLQQDNVPYMYLLAFEDEISWMEFGSRRYLGSFAILSCIAVLLLWIASFTGRLCFVDGLKRLVFVAKQTRQGEADVRCGEVAGCREVVILGHSFDDMLSCLQEKTVKLEKLSSHDPLTGLWNRRHFNEVAEVELSGMRRYGHPVSLAMADIDHFKSVNDTYGHAAGDLVLQHVSALFRQGLRSADIVGRFGGEEFVFLFPRTTGEQAVQLMERIRLACEQTSVDYEDQTIRFTCSFGVVELNGGESTTERLLEEGLRRADAALYTSKRSGRNQITLFGGEADLSLLERQDA